MKGLCLLGLSIGMLISSLFFPATAEATVEPILLRIAQRARESGSDAVLITHNGHVIFEYRSDLYWQPIEAMSITKSISALAILILIEEGKIASIDTPVYTFYPEWEQGNKKNITIRQILNHTTGLQADICSDEIYRFGDIVQFALCAELSTIPGTHFSYNNKAVNLISGIVKKASGMSLSEYLTVKLFAPLQIQNVSWLCDPTGNDYAMSHMIITAPDLSRIGTMLANGGNFCGKQILSQKSINFLTTPCQNLDPFCGALWWLNYFNIECYWDDCLLTQYRYSGIGQEYINRLGGLQGRVMNINGRTTTPRGCNVFSDEVIYFLGGKQFADGFYQQVRERHLPIANWKVGALRSFSARGYLGQQLIVIPSTKMVGVRQIRARGKDECEVDPFHDFESLVEELAYRMCDR